MSAPIDRPNNFGQAGHTYRSFEDWERDELIDNLGDALAVCEESIQQTMIEYFTKADEDYGAQVKADMEKKIAALKEQTGNLELGRASGQSKYGQGSIAANEATKEAVEKSRETDGY